MNNKSNYEYTNNHGHVVGADMLLNFMRNCMLKFNNIDNEVYLQGLASILEDDERTTKIEESIVVRVAGESPRWLFFR